VCVSLFVLCCRFFYISTIVCFMFIENVEKPGTGKKKRLKTISMLCMVKSIGILHCLTFSWTFWIVKAFALQFRGRRHIRWMWFLLFFFSKFDLFIMHVLHLTFFNRNHYFFFQSFLPFWSLNMIIKHFIKIISIL
jgi:hypothetical protein